MAQKKNDEPASDFPPEQAKPALRALHGTNLYRLDQLTNLKASNLKKLHGMGPKALGLLQQALADKGLTFADE